MKNAIIDITFISTDTTNIIVVCGFYWRGEVDEALSTAIPSSTCGQSSLKNPHVGLSRGGLPSAVFHLKPTFLYVWTELIEEPARRYVTGRFTICRVPRKTYILDNFLKQNESYNK